MSYFYIRGLTNLLHLFYVFVGLLTIFGKVKFNICALALITNKIELIVFRIIVSKKYLHINYRKQSFKIFPDSPLPRLSVLESCQNDRVLNEVLRFDSLYSFQKN